MAQTDHAGVVERYLGCLAVHDWDGLAATIADEDLVREGPYCDVDQDRQCNVTFFRGVFASLVGYRLYVHRVSPAPDRGCYDELSENFDVDGVPTEYPECLVFEQNPDGLINR